MEQCRFKGNPILRFFRLCLIYNLEKGKPDRKEREKTEKEGEKKSQSKASNKPCSDEDSIKDRSFLILSPFSPFLLLAPDCSLFFCPSLFFIMEGELESS
jgi:hypothetical protein